jgi:hypothetical protein
MSLSRFDKYRSMLEADLASLPDLPEAAPLANLTPVDDVQSNPPPVQSRLPSASSPNSTVRDRTGQAEAEVVDSEPPPPPKKLPANTLKVGEPGPPDQAYCLLLLFSKFPYRFIKAEDKERVADKFWNAGKFWLHEWDLYVSSLCSPSIVSSG